MTQTNPRPHRFLRTFGAPDLVAGSASMKLRAKDLALLAYLRLQPSGTHRRTVLAGLLWAENSERGARHSLTQAVVRLRKVLGERAILTTRETVMWAGELPCDAALLEDAAGADAPSLLEFYEGEFMDGLALGAGTQVYENWVAARRVEYRDLAADLADRWGADAEARGDWAAALRFAQRAVEIDYYLETGHRRIMRALAATGERNRALQHYAQYAAQVRREMGLAPQTETSALAEQIRGRSAPPGEPGPGSAPPSTPDPDPGPDAGAVLPAPPDPVAPHDDADPRASPAPREPPDVSAARRKWFAAGVVAASVVMAFMLGRAGVRAT